MKTLTASKVALQLDISTRTLLSWYRWNALVLDTDNRHPDAPELPKYEQAYRGAPRFWDEDDLIKLKAFHDWLPKGRGGVMGAINARNWGDRGRRATINKALKNSK